MKSNYDFTKGKRGAVVTPSGNKSRITIRIDSKIIEWFKDQVEKAGKGNYQTLINDALANHIEQKEQSLEKLLRKVIREELKKIS